MNMVTTDFTAKMKIKAFMRRLTSFAFGWQGRRHVRPNDSWYQARGFKPQASPFTRVADLQAKFDRKLQLCDLESGIAPGFVTPTHNGERFTFVEKPYLWPRARKPPIIRVPLNAIWKAGQRQRHVRDKGRRQQCIRSATTKLAPI
jgi:hypothetical protein